MQSAALSVPPSSPADGQCWIVASGGSGAWTGKDFSVAAWQDGAWNFYPPTTGTLAYNDATGSPIVWTGLAWAPLASGGGSGGAVTSVAGRTGNVTLAVADVSGAAPLASPALTGSPTAPTPTAGDNSTRLATTGFVATATASFATVSQAAAAAPVQSVAGRTGAVTLAVADVSGAAPLASPALTGSPSAPTPTAGDNSTRLATTGFVAASYLVASNAPALGIGTAADSGNPLSTKLNSALFAALPTTASGTGDVRVKLSKQAAGNTASFLFQDNFSGRAEIGLTGDDNFHFKVSADGSTFRDALVLNAATGDAQLLSLNAGPLAGFRNRLINGNFGVNQRVQASGTALAAAAYGHDRWKAGTSGCTYAFTAAKPDTTITITAGTLLQVIEDANVEGGVYTLSWSGTASARVYQGSASGSYAASPITVTGLAAGTNTTVEFSTGTLGKVQFEPGPVATPFERRPIGTELGLCQRYFEKSYDQASAPGAVVSTGSPAVFVLGLPSSLYTGGTSVGFKAVKRADPTVTLYSPSTVGAAGKVRDYTNSVDVAGTAANTGDEGFLWYATGAVAATAFNFQCQWTASAEL